MDMERANTFPRGLVEFFFFFQCRRLRSNVFFLLTYQLLAQSGIQATSLRIGQMSGEAWATGDWVPNLVKSSIGLGALPYAAGVSCFFFYCVVFTDPDSPVLRSFLGYP